MGPPPCRELVRHHLLNVFTAANYGAVKLGQKGRVRTFELRKSHLYYTANILRTARTVTPFLGAVGSCDRKRSSCSTSAQTADL